MAKPEFIVRHNVPLLDEHAVRNESGEVILLLDETKLRKIANNHNRKLRETGDEVPLIVGHTRDGLPENQQPEIVGYASDFYVARLGKTKRKAIFARNYRVYRDREEVLRRYPRRSVELWLRRLEIDPISLLGATTPERSLGLVRRSREEGLHYSHTLEENMESNDIVQQVISALQQTDEWKFIGELMKEAGGQMDKEHPGEENMGEPQEGVEGDPEAIEGEEPQRYESSAPSPSNTFIPSGSQGDRRQPLYPMNSAPSNKINPTLQRMERQLHEQRKVNAGLILKFQRLEREKDLLKLQAEDGIELDIQDELDDAQSLSAEAWRKRMDRIRVRYQRAPVNSLEGVLTHARTPSGKPISREEAMTAAETALRKGVAYEDALKETGTPTRVF